MKKLTEKEINEACAAIHKLATVIMERRQEGVAMRDMLKVFSPSDVYQRLIVVYAYIVQRFEDKTDQQSVIKKFADRTVSDYQKKLRIQQSKEKKS